MTNMRNMAWLIKLLNHTRESYYLQHDWSFLEK